jgi:hypothetical protein
MCSGLLLTFDSFGLIRDEPVDVNEESHFEH